MSNIPPAVVPSAYNPLLADATWAMVEPFVREVIASRCGKMTARQVQEHKRTLAYFGDWIVQTGMVPLEQALSADVIDVYTADRAREVVPTMAERERKMLRRLASIPPTVERRDVSTASAPERPYTDAELASFAIWANHQRTTYQQVSCLAVFTLGVGCGLTAGEILAASRADLVAMEGVPAVRVARDGRVVPVIDRWRSEFEKLAAIAAPGLLVAPNATERKSAMRSVLGDSIGEVKPTPTRLRMTWLVAHLEAGTPLAALLAASGMRSTDSLRRAMEFVRPVPSERYVAAMRMTETPR